MLCGHLTLSVSHTKCQNGAVFHHYLRGGDCGGEQVLEEQGIGVGNAKFARLDICIRFL